MKITNYKRHMKGKEDDDKLGKQLLGMKTLRDKDRIEAILELTRKNKDIMNTEVLENIFGHETGRSFEALRKENEQEINMRSFNKTKQKILDLNGDINELTKRLKNREKNITLIKNGFFVEAIPQQNEDFVNLHKREIERLRHKRDELKKKYADIYPTSPYVRIIKDVNEADNQQDYEFQFNRSHVDSIEIYPKFTLHKDKSLILNVALNTIYQGSNKFGFRNVETPFTSSQLNKNTLLSITAGNYTHRRNYDGIMVVLQMGMNTYTLITGERIIPQIYTKITAKETGRKFTPYKYIHTHFSPKNEDNPIPELALFLIQEKLFPDNILEYFREKYLEEITQQIGEPQIGEPQIGEPQIGEPQIGEPQNDEPIVVGDE